MSGIAGWAMEYVWPLNDWYDRLLGDPGQVQMFASTWEKVDVTLAQLERELTDAGRGIADFEGRTARALRKRHEDLAVILTDASEWSGATAAALRLAATVVAGVREAICGFLTELAAFIRDLFGFTLNPFEKVEQLRRLSNHAYNMAESGGRLVQYMFDAFAQLIALFQRLVPLIEEVLDEVRLLLAEIMPYVALVAGSIVGGPVVGVLSYLIAGAGADVISDTPDVNELDPGTLTPEQRDLWTEADKMTEMTSFGDIVNVNGLADNMGGDAQTIIDIKKVVDADGNVTYVVAMPSTLDWNLPNDTGATNDLHSNMLLMLNNPALRTQYERAILEAMDAAGIPHGSNVVLTGFSQGGIMAGHLASDPSFPYNTTGIITNGAPIQTFDIPSKVAVVSFEHPKDPVSMLDGPFNTDVFDDPNHHRVVLEDRGIDPLQNHNNDNYVESINNFQAQNPDAYNAMWQQLGLDGTQVVEHQAYAWHE